MGGPDDASWYLARALQRPPARVEAVLADVGVDAPYLARSLLEGDPQGAVADVSQRLGVTPTQLAEALLASRAHELPRPVPPRLRRQAAWLAAGLAGLGVLCMGLASLWFLDRALLARLLVALGAVGAAALGATALVLALRVARVARRP